MSRTTLNLIIEGAIVTSIVSAFVLTTATSAKPAPKVLAMQPMSISQSDRLPVPSPPTSVLSFPSMCIGQHAAVVCAAKQQKKARSGGGNNVEPVIVQPANPTQKFLIPGKVEFFSGNAMDPQAIGTKFNLLDLR